MFNIIQYFEGFTKCHNTLDELLILSWVLKYNCTFIIYIEYLMEVYKQLCMRNTNSNVDLNILFFIWNIT